MCYSKDMSETSPVYWKIVLIMFYIKKAVGILHESGYAEIDNNRQCLKYKKLIIEQIEEYLDYNKNEEESFIEKFSPN